MQALLVTMGSMGNTLPFIALGKTLRSRGHHVALIANGHFRAQIEGAGLEFVESSSDADYLDFVRRQSSWKRGEALRAMTELLIGETANVYRLVAERAIPGETVLAALGYAFGARIAQEKLGLPLATVHLQPMWFRSIYDPPGQPAWCPLWIPRAIDRLLDWIADRALGPATNAFRAELGLAPAKRLMKYWWNSPQLVVGFFPDWYNPPQPDWPPNSLLPGFPLEPDGSGAFDMSEVNGFLVAGEPPLVFSQSSVTMDAAYFAESAKAASLLKRRAIFLTSHPEQVPADLPAEVRCFRFVPLEGLLPRALAHVHHGGIGTIGHTLAAGIPQVTVPMVNDQQDNSRRLLRLGVSTLIRRKEFRADDLAEQLRRLLGSEDVAQHCRLYAEKCRPANALETTAIALERLHASG